jgi:hypothetical protein
MKLLSSTEIKENLGLRDITDVDEFVEAAGLNVTLYLEALLRTEFAQGSSVDLFQMWSQDISVLGRSYTQLRLTRGFVDSGVAVVLSTGPDRAALTAVDAAEYDVNYEKGVITWHKVPSEGHWISVAYDSGFVNFNEVYDGVPRWLQMAALRFTDAIYERMDEEDRKRQAPDGTPPKDVRILLKDRVRENHNALRPYHTTFTAAG